MLRDLEFGDILVLGKRVHGFLQIKKSLVHIFLPSVLDRDAGGTGTNHGRYLCHVALPDRHRLHVLDKLLLDLLRRTFASLQLDKEAGTVQVGQQVDCQLVVGNLAQQQNRQYQHKDRNRIAYRKFDDTFHF